MQAICSPLGDQALVLSVGDRLDTQIDPQINRALTVFANHLALDPFAGFVEATPALDSITIYFDLKQTRYKSVEAYVLHRWRGQSSDFSSEEKRLIEIPVVYDGHDLPNMARHTGLRISEIIDLHAARIYRVYMMGFMPGFAYMGEVDPRIAIGRHATPRHRVEAGSVGIAGKQTGIYPLASTGGWQIIGRTSLTLFDPSSPEPALLRAGDQIRFRAV